MQVTNLGAVSLKDKQINQLVKLEQLFHSHYLTEQLINGMINLYVKFTQNILHNQQSIRLYFMQKIKFVLSRSEVIRILEKRSNQENKNIRQGTKEGRQMTQQQELQINRIAEQAKEEIRRNHNMNGKKQRVYVNTAKGQQLRQKQRNMQIKMQLQIKNQLEQNMLKMKKEFNDSDSWENKENQINKIVQKQDNALKQRLAKRKKKLRKKSAEINDKEVIELEAAPPIERKQLLEMKKQLNQTYQRFTRLTMNKTSRATQLGKPNEGRVKIRVQEDPIQQEDIFDQMEIQRSSKKKQNNGFSKKNIEDSQPPPSHNNPLQKLQNMQKANPQCIPRQSDTTIEYKAFDQNKGRVTVRQKKYEQIDDEQEF